MHKGKAEEATHEFNKVKLQNFIFLQNKLSIINLYGKT